MNNGQNELEKQNPQDFSIQLSNIHKKVSIYIGNKKINLLVCVLGMFFSRRKKIKEKITLLISFLMHFPKMRTEVLFKERKIE